MKRDEKPVSDACVETTSIAPVPDFLEANVLVKQLRSFKVLWIVAEERFEVPDRRKLDSIAHRFIPVVDSRVFAQHSHVLASERRRCPGNANLVSICNRPMRRSGPTA